MTTATGRLWRSAERELLAAAPGVSLDDLVALRDGCWFGENGGRPRPLQTFLRYVALRHLDGPRGRCRSSSAAPAGRPDRGPTRARAGPAVVAMADVRAAGGPPARHGGPRRVGPSRPTCSRRRYVTCWPAASPRPICTWALRSISGACGRCSWLAWPHPGLRVADLAAPGAALQEGLDLPAWLLRCAIARMVLAGFLSSGSDGRPGPRTSGAAATRSCCHSGGRRHLLPRAPRHHRPAQWEPCRRDVPHTMLQDAYAALTGTRASASVQDVPSAWALNPVRPAPGPRCGVPGAAPRHAGL